ncbi:hypothetical protein DERP_015157 [Dermatophagoides pteronyssinus]|uniref:Uncharacterized protein n=1 Tax=Dermatophagoides pteronyssinus TaxID=6956 RepID=A0ABQ8JUQ0_DERPT|nr:hypothetical protein DERP_015157 [Dermatophagoides pteronyssinus]
MITDLKEEEEKRDKQTPRFIYIHLPFNQSINFHDSKNKESLKFIPLEFIGNGKLNSLSIKIL